MHKDHTTAGPLKVTMNNLQKLEQLGQSIWYDNIRRGMILNGELRRMVEERL